jgi:hypothetical protein
LRRNHLAAHWFCRGSGTGAGPLVLKGERGCTQNRTCADSSGGSDELTAADCFHGELLSDDVALCWRARELLHRKRIDVKLKNYFANVKDNSSGE